MEAFYSLKKQLYREVEELSRKGEIGAGDLELLHKLTDTIKNIDKICALEGEDESGYSQNGYSRDGYSQRRYSRDGHSQDGNWMANIRGSYGRGNSYANRGKHWVRGHYSRDYDGENSMSRGYSRDSMSDHLEQMMREAATEEERETIRRCMQAMD